MDDTKTDEPPATMRRVVCDECGKENLTGCKRAKCLDCHKMLCRFCTAVLQGDGQRCADCRRVLFMEFVERNGRRTTREQIAISVGGERVFGIPRIGPNV